MLNKCTKPNFPNQFNQDGGSQLKLAKIYWATRRKKKHSLYVVIQWNRNKFIFIIISWKKWNKIQTTFEFQPQPERKRCYFRRNAVHVSTIYLFIYILFSTHSRGLQKKMIKKLLVGCSNLAWNYFTTKCQATNKWSNGMTFLPHSRILILAMVAEWYLKLCFFFFKGRQYLVELVFLFFVVVVLYDCLVYSLYLHSCICMCYMLVFGANVFYGLAPSYEHVEK